MMFEKIKKYIKALKNSKRYENIVPLGYNCEIAYRFYRKFGFFDSSLFGWSYVTFEQLKNALSNFDFIGKGDLEYDKASHMFKCKNTGIFFHGRTPADAFTDNEEENLEIIKKDEEELRSRVEYLKEKFVKYATNGKNTLYILKIKSNNDVLRKEIIWLYEFMKDFCKNDFCILLITEKSFYSEFLFDNPKILTRYVEKYSPDECVTSKKQGDAFGWKLIFTEFKPKKYKKQKGKLKFEVSE